MREGFIILIFLSSKLFAQNSLLIPRIDSSVKSINQLNKKKEIFLTDLGQYEFITKDSFIVKVVYEFRNNYKKVKKEFYFEKLKGIIYATETETNYLGNDSVIWIGRFYFEKSRLADYITIGHGKSETDDWEPEKDILVSYYKVLDRITSYQLRSKAE